MRNEFVPHGGPRGFGPWGGTGRHRQLQSHKGLLREASPCAQFRDSIRRAKALPMSGTAEYVEVQRRAALAISELPVWLTVSVATVTGVTWALASTPASTRNIALPVFVLGAGAMFGSGLADLSRARDIHVARALMVAGVLWSL